MSYSSILSLQKIALKADSVLEKFNFQLKVTIGDKHGWIPNRDFGIELNIPPGTITLPQNDTRASDDDETTSYLWTQDFQHSYRLILRKGRSGKTPEFEADDDETTFLKLIDKVTNYLEKNWRLNEKITAFEITNITLEEEEGQGLHKVIIDYFFIENIKAGSR